MPFDRVYHLDCKPLESRVCVLYTIVYSISITECGLDFE